MGKIAIEFQNISKQYALGEGTSQSKGRMYMDSVDV